MEEARQTSNVHFNGTGVIMIPKDMTHDEAINRINADAEMRSYGEKTVRVEETIRRFPYEAAHALVLAINHLHGASIGHDVQLPDGNVIANKLIGVPVSATESVQVPWGPFHLPDVEGEFMTDMVEEKGLMFMRLSAKVKRKYAGKVKALADLTRKLADEYSIYRGKAIMVRFRNDDGEYDMFPPEFMDLSGDHKVILSRAVMHEIKVNLLAPIRHAARARKLRIPTKRGVLLAGRYGSGKTLTARWLAKECAAQGRTFLYAKDATEFADALRIAALYSPALVFAEDIDRVIQGPRTVKMDEMLNTVDGVDTKDQDVITVLTTNNLHFIHPAFLREGRSDAIIQIDRPDVEAAEQLMRHFGGELVEPGARLHNLASMLADKSPAFIREVVERSKLTKLAELDDADLAAADAEVEISLSAQDLELAFHHHLAEREHVDDESDEAAVMMRLVQEFEKRGGRVHVQRQ